MIALVDCNSFFCSCERLFRPEIREQPVGVLSNNDGCFISRTPELKALGVPMGAPYFKFKDYCSKNNVHVFSSNYALYASLSARVIQCLKNLSPEVEVYSIDEAFMDLSGIKNLQEYAHKIKQTVEMHTGIPVSVGVAPTKTLAKVANNLAKKNKEAGGVIVLNNEAKTTWALKATLIQDVWGVGRKSVSKMQSLGIKTAYDYKKYSNTKLIQKIFSKVGLARQEELNSLKRFNLNLTFEPKKQIMVSRSFGQKISSLDELSQAVASFIHSAAAKLRHQNSVCTTIGVFVRTSPFSGQEFYKASDFHTLEASTADSIKLTVTALNLLKNLYKAGPRYAKAGVFLGSIRPGDHFQMSLFEEQDSPSRRRLMDAIDLINAKEGSLFLTSGACGVQSKSKAWSMNKRMKSPRYLNDWADIPTVG